MHTYFVGFIMSWLKCFVINFIIVGIIISIIIIIINFIIIIIIIDCNQTCGGELSGVNHYFSPLDCDGDGKYDFNLECFWNITVENHQKVRLIISGIHIQEGEEYACVNDYLQVW